MDLERERNRIGGLRLPFRQRANIGFLRVVGSEDGRLTGHADPSLKPKHDSGTLYTGVGSQRLLLPRELLVEVFKNLGKALDKGNVRLVCRAFADAVSPSLTTTAYLSPRHKILCSAYEMARHPVVSKYIKKVVCSGAQLEWRLDRHELRQRCKDFGYSTYSAPPIGEISDRFAWDYDRETHISGSGELRGIFSKILVQFVNLEWMTFTDTRTDERIELVQHYTWPAIPPTGDLWGFPSPYHVFVTAMRSLSASGIKLRQLSIEGRDCGIAHRLFSTPSESDLNHLLNVFKTLRAVDFTINTDQRQDPVTFEGLGRLLGHATTLERLHLEFTNRMMPFIQSRQAHASELSMSSAFRNTTWHYLKLLSIADTTICPDDELLAFFERHRGTLTYVGFQHVYLTHRVVRTFLSDSFQFGTAP